MTFVSGAAFLNRHAYIRNRFEAGQSAAQIAETLNISVSTVYRALGHSAPRKGSRTAHSVVNVRVTEAELAGLDRAVDHSGVKNRSVFIRRFVRMAADMPSLSPGLFVVFLIVHPLVATMSNKPSLSKYRYLDP